MNIVHHSFLQCVVCSLHSGKCFTLLSSAVCIVLIEKRALCALWNVHHPFLQCVLCCLHWEMCFSNLCCAAQFVLFALWNVHCVHCEMDVVLLYCSHCGMCIPPCRFTLRSRCHLSISLHRPLNNWHKINTKHKHGTWTVGTYYQPQKFKEPKLQFDLSIFGFGTAWGHPSCQFWIDSLKQPFHFTWYLEVWFRVTQTWGILMIIWPDTCKTGIYEKLAHVWATCAVNFLRQHRLTLSWRIHSNGVPPCEHKIELEGWSDKFNLCMTVALI